MSIHHFIFKNQDFAGEAAAGIGTDDVAFFKEIDDLGGTVVTDFQTPLEITGTGFVIQNNDFKSLADHIAVTGLEIFFE